MDTTNGGPGPRKRIDLDALAEAVNAELAEQPARVKNVDPETLAKLMDRAKKLLAKGEASPFQGERDAYADKAAAIMATYGITAAMMAHGGSISNQVSDWTVEVSAPLCYDKVSLLAAIVKVYGGRIIYARQDTQLSTLRVHAMPADLERTQVLWPSLLKQMTTEMGWATATKPAGVRADVFARSFITGFVGVVMNRLDAAEQYAARQAQADRDTGGVAGTSVVLVVAAQRRLVDLAFTEAHPKVTKGRRTLKASSAGITAGQRAGQRADLGQSKVGG